MTNQQASTGQHLAGFARTVTGRIRPDSHRQDSPGQSQAGFARTADPKMIMLQNKP